MAVLVLCIELRGASSVFFFGCCFVSFVEHCLSVHFNALVRVECTLLPTKASELIAYVAKGNGEHLMSLLLVGVLMLVMMLYIFTCRFVLLHLIA